MRGGLAAGRRKAAMTTIAALAVITAGTVVAGCSGGGRPASGGPSSAATVAALPAVTASPGPSASSVPASTQLATLRVTCPGTTARISLAAGPCRPAGRAARRAAGARHRAGLGAGPARAAAQRVYRVAAGQRREAVKHPVRDRHRPGHHAPVAVRPRPPRVQRAGRVGTDDDPTPPGGYFVAFAEGPPEPNPGYGPFILVTSAHSPKITDWEGSGDAVIGIHGPLGDDGEIGTTGARISHGCIRLHDAALKRLSGVPAGTPVDIIR